MQKNLIVVTGGAGFVGSNLISYLLNKSKYDIISIDNYSSGSKKNHIKSKRVIYIHSCTSKIEFYLKKKRNKIKTIFHFGEFSRIFQSFNNFENCLNSNIFGTQAVFNFCMKNKIKLIYSATSASLGNNGEDENLSPYAYSKAKNLEFLENLKKWFKLRYEVIYFYNVYGKNQIGSGHMATVIGIFEKQYISNLPLTVVKPGSQTRKFTHIDDTIKACIYAWKQNKCKHYSISAKKEYSIIKVAKMFGGNIKYLKEREGERFASALTKTNLSNKIVNLVGKKSIKEYISMFKKKHLKYRD